MKPWKLSDMSPALRSRVEAVLASVGIQGRKTASDASKATCSFRAGHRGACPKGPNNTEAAYNRDILSGKGIYEGLTLRLPGGSRYTPDWLSVCALGFVHLHEVKGSYRFPSEGRALTAWREARAAFPMFRFHWAVLTKEGWEFRHVDGNPAVEGRRDQTNTKTKG